VKVIVKSKAVRRDEFVNKATGQLSVNFKQSAALDSGGDFVLPFDVRIKENQPYEPGEYALAPECFRVSRFGGLEINPFDLRLIPLKLHKVA